MSGSRYPGLSAVVFDLDGTLVHSAPDIAAAANVALHEARLPTLPVDAIVRMVGHGSEVLITRALTAAMKNPPLPDVVAATHARFLSAYAAAPCVATLPYPDAIEMLQQLRGAGFKLAICTNKPDAITRQVLNALSMTHLFDAIVGSTTQLALKPAPDMLRHALQLLSAAPEKSIMVGDSRADAGAALSAGTKLVLLRHGYSTDDVATLGADAVLAGLTGLPTTLQQMTATPASPI